MNRGGDHVGLIKEMRIPQNVAATVYCVCSHSAAECCSDSSEWRVRERLESKHPVGRRDRNECKLSG